MTIRVDLLDEEPSLLDAMRRLTDDAGLRERVARAGHAYWSAHHTLDLMAEDYRRVLVAASSRPAPTPEGLPRHFLDDHSETARRLVQQFGVSVDVFD